MYCTATSLCYEMKEVQSKGSKKKSFAHMIYFRIAYVQLIHVSNSVYYPCVGVFFKFIYLYVSVFFVFIYFYVVYYRCMACID